jgi:hypothetical protein
LKQTFCFSGDPNFQGGDYENDGGKISLGKLTQSVGSHVAAVDLNDIYVSVVRYNFLHLMYIELLVVWLQLTMKYIDLILFQRSECMVWFTVAYK